MCPCCFPPSLWLPNSGSCNHTHFQILSISTNVAHLSKGWKECGERRRYAGKEAGREQWKRKMKKRIRRNDLAEPALPFSSPSTSFSLLTSNWYCVFVCVCVSGQACGCFKASVQKAQINPTAYVFRNYHVCWLVFIVCVSVHASGSGSQPCSNKKSWHGPTSLLMLILNHSTLNGEQG